MKKEYKNYKIKLTMKSAMLYEQLSGKPFLEFGGADTTEQDVLQLMYAMLVANNDVVLTFNSFNVLYGDESFSKWINGAFTEAMSFNKQFNPSSEQENPVDVETEDVDPGNAMMSRVAAALIAGHGMDADYVLNKMYMFEIPHYMKVIDEKEKARMVEQRLWTFLTIAPHIDTKKISSPQKMIPFEWEDTVSEQKLAELRRHKEEAKRIIGMEIKGLFKKKEVKND